MAEVRTNPSNAGEAHGVERGGAGRPQGDRFFLSDMLSLLDASSDSATVDETYESTMSQLVDITGMKGMALVLYANGSYAVASSCGIPESLASNIGTYPREFSAIFESLEDATEPLPFYDANEDEFFPDLFRHRMEYNDVVYIPIRHQGILLGFLCMGKTEPGRWSQDDLAFFSIIGRLSGIVIYRALVTERHRREAIARERACTEARIRESIIQVLGISVIEEQLNPGADGAGGTANGLSAAPSGPGSTAHLIDDVLSPREKDVLRQVTTGASNSEIARNLYISTGTVKMTLQSILRKLNVRNRVEAAVYAVEAGLGPETP